MKPYLGLILFAAFLNTTSSLGLAADPITLHDAVKDKKVKPAIGGSGGSPGDTGVFYIFEGKTQKLSSLEKTKAKGFPELEAPETLPEIKAGITEFSVRFPADAKSFGISPDTLSLARIYSNFPLPSTDAIKLTIVPASSKSDSFTLQTDGELIPGQYKFWVSTSAKNFGFKEDKAIMIFFDGGFVVKKRDEPTSTVSESRPLSNEDVFLITGVLVNRNKSPIVGQTIWFLPINDTGTVVKFENSKPINPTCITDKAGRFALKVNVAQVDDQSFTLGLDATNVGGPKVLRKNGKAQGYKFKVDKSSRVLNVGEVAFE